MTKRNDVLFYKLKNKNIQCQHVAEVGVYLPETSNIGAFANAGVRSSFVEPDPNSLNAIRKLFGEKENITIYPVAVFDKSGRVELVQRKASTYLKMLDSSPAIINDEYKIDEDDVFEVDAVTFDEIDDGSIDLLSIDIEGGEWFVLKHMQSKPQVLSIETHGAMYTNPFINEINNWIAENDYVVWYMDGSDTVYIKQKLFPVSKMDKFKLWLTKIALAYKKYRKTVKRKIRNLFKAG